MLGVNRDSAEPEAPSSWRVERRIWWFTVSDAAEGSSGMRMRMMKKREAAVAVFLCNSMEGRVPSNQTGGGHEGCCGADMQRVEYLCDDSF